MSETKTHPIRIKDLMLIFLKIGTIGFGGGVATLALLRKYLVNEKRWITDDDLATAVALGQMIPGPFIPNYVEYIGFRLRGLKGMIASVITFLAPGFLAMVVLCYLYFQTQRVLVINHIFSWIQPIIIGILAWASFDMGRLYVRNFQNIVIMILALVASLFKIMPLITVLVCGALGIIFTKRPKININTFVPVLLLISISPWAFNAGSLASLMLIFFEVGALIFGGGYAAIPVIAQEVVMRRQWLTNQELITGVALSQITPGPVALLATFVGYKVSGIFGALLATIAIFLPSAIILLIILNLYRYFIKTNRAISDYVKGFIAGIKPAIVGFLISATVILAINNGVLITNTILFSIIKISLVIIIFLLLLRFKVSPVWLILGGAGIGLILTKIIT